MADFSALIAQIRANIRANLRFLITGPVLQDQLVDMVDDINEAKQDNLTFDDAPTQGSDNPAKSGGIYDAIDARIPKADIVQTLAGTSPTKVPSQNAVRIAVEGKKNRAQAVYLTDWVSDEPIATYNGVDYYDTDSLFSAIVVQGRSGVAADATVLEALGITYALLEEAMRVDAGLFLGIARGEFNEEYYGERDQYEWDGDATTEYRFHVGPYYLDFYTTTDPDTGDESLNYAHFWSDAALHRSDIVQNVTGTSTVNVPSQKAVKDAVDGLNTAIGAKYTKPATGIPFDDMDSGVKSSLEAADNAIPANSDLDGYIPVVNSDGLLSSSGITPADVVKGDGITDVVAISQADYNNLGTYDPTTLYVIV